MKLFGLTGGVGMGKSTAAGLLLQSGARVVDTDEIARDLVQPGQPALAEISAVFGNKILNADGGLDRAELAKIIFADEAARKNLELILHPRIRERWQSQIEIWRAASTRSDDGRQEKCALAVVVIPLLFETHAENSFDKIICVACSLASQRARLAARGWTAEQVGQRIAAQMPVEQKIARAHFVIWTEGILEVHRRQIIEIIGGN